MDANGTSSWPRGIYSRNFFAIDIGDADGGEGDRMWGEEGDDIMLGQQGDDRMWGGCGDDDMIGGHNVAGGCDELAPAPARSAWSSLGRRRSTTSWTAAPATTRWPATTPSSGAAATT